MEPGTSGPVFVAACPRLVLLCCEAFCLEDCHDYVGRSGRLRHKNNPTTNTMAQTIRRPMECSHPRTWSRPRVQPFSGRFYGIVDEKGHGTRHFTMACGMGHNFGQSHDGVVQGVYQLNGP